MPIYLEGLGTVQAFYTVTVTARVDGELQKIGFTEGQTVHKGDLLAQIDPRPYQAAFEQAIATKAKDAAQLANAKLDLDRYTLLQPQNLASKQTVDTQHANGRSAHRADARSIRPRSTMRARNSTTRASPRRSTAAPAFA